MSTPWRQWVTSIDYVEMQLAQMLTAPSESVPTFKSRYTDCCSLIVARRWAEVQSAVSRDAAKDQDCAASKDNLAGCEKGRDKSTV